MKLDSPPTEQLDPAISSSSSPQPVSEKLVFLCGQCNEGFPSLEACKQHMMQVIHRNSTLLWTSFSPPFCLREKLVTLIFFLMLGIPVGMQTQKYIYRID
jgi:hypothetical protein